MNKFKIYFDKEAVTAVIPSDPSLGQEKGKCILDTLEGGKDKLTKLGLNTDLIDRAITDQVK